MPDSEAARAIGRGHPPIRLRLLAIGRLRRGPLAELQALYAGAHRAACRRSSSSKKGGACRAPALKAREAELILEALPAGARLVALDERGASVDEPRSRRPARGWRDQGTGELAFAIGGADGLGAAVIERADAVLSLGPMTWPHLLVRGMLLEQLYRAQQILAGHPYHRE